MGGALSTSFLGVNVVLVVVRTALLPRDIAMGLGLRTQRERIPFLLPVSGILETLLKVPARNLLLQ